MGHVMRKFSIPLVQVGQSANKSEPSTSEAENTALCLLRFYKAAGVGALDHLGVEWTAWCDVRDHDLRPEKSEFHEF